MALGLKEQLQSTLEEWIAIDAKTKAMQLELNQLLVQRRKIDDQMRRLVEANGLQNSKIKMNGTSFLMRCSKTYAAITHRFLQAALNRLFASGIPKSADGLMSAILLERTAEPSFSICPC